MRLELTSTEYIIGRPNSHKCFSALNVSSDSKNHWIFGLQVLRRYYTVYHYDYGLGTTSPTPTHLGKLSCLEVMKL
ncbi:hypothetical protein BG000_011214 [Podila horticola]|nr:hypothetical protein BG000_011214 [Podila horticola]